MRPANEKRPVEAERLHRLDLEGPLYGSWLDLHYNEHPDIAKQFMRFFLTPSSNKPSSIHHCHAYKWCDLTVCLRRPTTGFLGPFKTTSHSKSRWTIKGNYFWNTLGTGFGTIYNGDSSTETRLTDNPNRRIQIFVNNDVIIPTTWPVVSHDVIPRQQLLAFCPSDTDSWRAKLNSEQTIGRQLQYVMTAPRLSVPPHVSPIYPTSLPISPSHKLTNCSRYLC